MLQLWIEVDEPEIALPYNPNKNPINQSRQPQSDKDDKWIVQFLNEIQVGHISTRDGNQPFINPTSFWYSSENHEIYFHSNAYGRMRFNADQHPEACFECFKSGKRVKYEPSGYELPGTSTEPTYWFPSHQKMWAVGTSIVGLAATP